MSKHHHPAPPAAANAEDPARRDDRPEAADRPLRKLTHHAPDVLGDLLRPPPHVPRKCAAHARTTGEPCRNWVVIGRTRCRMHGGARGSGRPAVHGKRSAQAARNRRFLAVARQLLAQHYEKPAPVDPTEPTVEAPLVPGAPTGGTQ